MDSNYRSNTGTGKSSAAAAPQLTGEAAAEFQQGINLLLSRWTALQMAVQSEWGGPQSRLKSQQLELDLFSLLAGSKGFQFRLNFLNFFFENEFSKFLRFSVVYFCLLEFSLIFSVFSSFFNFIGKFGCSERVYMDDVEDLLDDSMLSLGTEIADGSIEEVLSSAKLFDACRFELLFIALQ